MSCALVCGKLLRSNCSVLRWSSIWDISEMKLVVHARHVWLPTIPASGNVGAVQFRLERHRFWKQLSSSSRYQSLSIILNNCAKISWLDVILCIFFKQNYVIITVQNDIIYYQYLSIYKKYRFTFVSLCWTIPFKLMIRSSNYTSFTSYCKICGPLVAAQSRHLHLYYRHSGSS